MVLIDNIIGIEDFKGTPIEKGVEEQEFAPYDQDEFNDYMDKWKHGKILDKDGKKIKQSEAIQNAFKTAKK